MVHIYIVTYQGPYQFSQGLFLYAQCPLYTTDNFPEIKILSQDPYLHVYTGSKSRFTCSIFTCTTSSHSAQIYRSRDHMYRYGVHICLSMLLIYLLVVFIPILMVHGNIRMIHIYLPQYISTYPRHTCIYLYMIHIHRSRFHIYTHPMHVFLSGFSLGLQNREKFFYY